MTMSAARAAVGRALALGACLALSMALVTGCNKSEQAKAPGNGATAKVKVVNAKCPMMGNPLSADGVPANLTRDFKGQKVGFCCAGCPGSWDKLSDEEKAKKLAAAMVPAVPKVPK